LACRARPFPRSHPIWGPRPRQGPGPQQLVRR
jgi:hypothetical protein